MKKYLLTAILISVLALPACEKLLLNPEESKPPLPAVHQSRLATLLDSLRYALDLPALAGAIVTDTGIVEAQAVGCRRYGGPENVTVNDQFHLGSCGKVFTSVLMGLLVDEGKVKWTTTLPEIFPEYASLMRPEYRDVTVKDLLAHSAGFMRDHDLNMKLKSDNTRSQRNEVLLWAFAQPPAQKHGYYLYSNLGFMIAGAVIEKLTDNKYEDLLMQRVIKPLGLTTAGVGGPMGTYGLEDEPLQHTCNHAPIAATPEASMKAIYNPAGGLYMSVKDWGKFVQWLLSIEDGHQTLLQNETAKMITSPITNDMSGGYYGLGIGVFYADWAGGKALSHSGSNGFNYSSMLLSAANKYGVIVMTNQGAQGDDWLLGPAVLRLLEFYTNKHF